MKVTELKNHKFVKQIFTFDELVKVLDSDISIYWMFKIFPTAFFLQWSIIQLRKSLKRGNFCQIKKITKKD